MTFFPDPLCFTGSKMCILATSVIKDTISRSLVNLIKELRIHHDHVVVMCCCEHIPSNDFSDDGIFFVPVKNWCYDFGQWCTMILHLIDRPFSMITLVNDSVILIRNMSEYMNWGLTNKYEMWGLTKSFEIKPHVQSYLRTFTGRGVDELKKFVTNIEVRDHLKKIEKLPIPKLRSEIINKYEVGMSVILEETRLSTGCVFESYKNPSWHNWDSYINDPRFCVLKKKRAFHDCDIISLCDDNLRSSIIEEFKLDMNKKKCRRNCRMRKK